MGQAKQRRQNDTFYGAACGYTIILCSPGEDLIAEIPVSIRWCGNLRRTNLRAIATTGLMAGWLADQQNLLAKCALKNAIGMPSMVVLDRFVQVHPIDRFHIRLTGAGIKQENLETGKDPDDCPEFSTEPIDGIDYKLDPAVLDKLAR